MLPFHRPRGGGDAGADGGVEQEMLAERLARIQPVPRDRLAQRRQVVG
jgi:hypothetical protein